MQHKTQGFQVWIQQMQKKYIVGSEPFCDSFPGSIFTLPYLDPTVKFWIKGGPDYWWVSIMKYLKGHSQTDLQEAAEK